MRINKVTEEINELCTNGEILGNQRRPIILTLSKKPSKDECKMQQIIILMNHITKLIIRILINRARRSVTLELVSGQ